LAIAHSNPAISKLTITKQSPNLSIDNRQCALVITLLCVFGAASDDSVPKDFECTTVPQFLDSAKVILTATIADSNLSIRLSHFITPGCAGHLSEIYLLDVITPGQEPRRFEFRHYHGVI
jgi:hypothetical protein